jgi:hypothetical protein
VQNSKNPQLSTLEQDGWCLESAEARHAATPDSFWIPPRLDRDSLKRGSLAQLLFQIAIPEDPDGEYNVERMWVEVRGRAGDMYTGVLRNQPASVAEGEILDHGATVCFLAEHVIDISEESKRPDSRNVPPN